MNIYLKHFWTLLSFLLLVNAPFEAFSQIDTLRQSGTNQPEDLEVPSEIHTLFGGLGAGSNMVYLGSTLSNDRPFYSSSITYGFKNAVYVSASASHLNSLKPYLAFYNGSVNYRHAFNSWLDIAADASGYRTTKPLKDSIFTDFAYINLTAGFDWKIIYTRVSLSGLFSEENGMFLQISNSRYFETPMFFRGKAMISFDPDINLLFGKLVTIESASGAKRYGLISPFKSSGKNPHTYNVKYPEKFGIIDVEFSIPLTFSYGNFSIEAETSYLLPAYSDPDNLSPKGFSFFLNAAVKIF
jgi:hypothetical protein